jgi:hypothetical protein
LKTRSEHRKRELKTTGFVEANGKNPLEASDGSRLAAEQAACE